MMHKATHTILLQEEGIVADVVSLLIPPATQLHLYCPQCGDVWLHAINNHDLYTHVYRPHRCRKHGNGILYPYFEFNHFPRNLLIREFLLELENPPKLRPNGLPELYNGSTQYPITTPENQNAPS